MRPRKITDIKTFLVGGSWRNWLIVKIETDEEGLHGIGEATLEGRSATAETAVHEVKRYLMGKDPFEIEKHFQELYRRAFYGGGAVLTSAISGVETAMWDIKGKALGVPVYEMLGGRVRDRVKLYANAWYRQGMSPEQMAEAAKAALKLGVQGMKFNPWGGREGIDFYRMDNNILNTGVDAVGAVREAVGPRHRPLHRLQRHLQHRGQRRAGGEGGGGIQHQLLRGTHTPRRPGRHGLRPQQAQHSDRHG